MNRKKWCFVVGGLLLTAIIVFVSTRVSTNSYEVKPDVTYTFDYITHNHLSEVKYITAEKEVNRDIASIMEEYQNGEYVLWDGDRGSTEHLTFYFANENSDVIFAVVDLGNRNLIQVLVDDTQYVYQKKK